MSLSNLLHAHCFFQNSSWFLCLCINSILISRFQVHQGCGFCKSSIFWKGLTWWLLLPLTLSSVTFTLLMYELWPLLRGWCFFPLSSPIIVYNSSFVCSDFTVYVILISLVLLKYLYTVIIHLDWSLVLDIGDISSSGFYSFLASPL